MHLRLLSENGNQIVVRDDLSANEYILSTFQDDLSKQHIMILDANERDIMNDDWCVKANGYAMANGIWCHRKVMQVFETLSSGLTVDHINRVKLDNRKENLRLATKHDQSINQGVRKDRNQSFDIFPRCIGDDIPRYIRWDEPEKKFRFDDHPIAKAAKQQNIIFNPSSTKSEAASQEDKLADCLKKLISLFQMMIDKGYVIEPQEIKDKRIRLGKEYNELC